MAATAGRNGGEGGGAEVATTATPRPSTRMPKPRTAVDMLHLPNETQRHIILTTQHPRGLEPGSLISRTRRRYRTNRGGRAGAASNLEGNGDFIPAIHRRLRARRCLEP